MPTGVAAAIVAVLAIAVYANTLLNGFVYDDNPQIIENPWVRDLAYLPRVFVTSVWDFLGEGGAAATYYRPLMYVAFILEYAAFGLEPWGWHLVNVIVHAGNGIMAFLVIRALMRNLPGTSEGGESNAQSNLFPMLGALVFALHPAKTEVVAWVSAVPELTFTLLVLSSLYLYVRWTELGGRWRYVSSVALFFAAPFAKETAMALPVFVVAFDYVTGRKPLRRIPAYVPYAAAGVIYLILRFLIAGGGSGKTGMHPYLDGGQVALNAVALVFRYITKLVFPVNLTHMHELNPVFSILEARSLAAILVAFGLPALFYLWRKKEPLLLLSYVFFLVPLLPVLYIPILDPNAFAERYAYLPSLGFSLFVAVVLRRVANSGVVERRKAVAVSTVVVLAVLAAYSAGTVQRNFEWRDDITLWESAAETTPRNPYALTVLGNLYTKNGEYRKAIETLEKSVEQLEASEHRSPNFLSFTHLGLGNAYRKAGLLERAAGEYRSAIEITPKRFDVRYNLGLTYLGMGDFAAAAAAYEEALELARKPSDVKDTLINLGNSYARAGNLAMAIKSYERALSLFPDDPTIRRNLMILRGRR